MLSEKKNSDCLIIKVQSGLYQNTFFSDTNNCKLMLQYLRFQDVQSHHGLVLVTIFRKNMPSLPIIDSQKKNAFPQSYAPTPHIEGVKIVQLKNFIADEGDFAEVIRLNEKGNLELFPEFHLR